MFRALPSLRPSLALYAFRTFATTVPANLVKQLRDSTGAPMMECKNALLASDNDVTKAVDWLRKKGKAAAMKSAGRTASQGLVAFAVNAGGNAGALIELNSETDFVARNALFQALAGRVAVSALEHLPPTLATTSEALGSEASLAAAGTLLTSPLVGGHVGGAGEGGCSVGEGVTGVIAQVRENMVLRRAVVVGGEGCLVTPYVHNSPGAGLGSIGVLVALRLKGKGGAPLSLAHPATPALQALSRRLAMHIAAANPQYLNRQDVPPEALERERAVLLEQGTSSAAAAAAAAAPKSPELMKKIIEGKLGKFFGECVLKEQTFALGEDSVKVEKWLEGEAKAQGAPPVEAVSFATFRVGAGGGSGNAPASA